MKITLKDGSVKEYAESKSVIDVAFDISEGLARAACAGEVDGEVVDLRTVLDKDCTLNILTAKDPEGLRVVRHTCSHVLAEAVKNLYPDVKLAIGPSIDTGYYYDFDAEPFSREDLDKIEKEMKKIIKKGAKLEKFTLPRDEAIKFMEEKNEPYKVELIQDLPEDAVISFYSQGDFVDLCAGPHLMSTKGIKAFKLTSSSGAYWRGDSNRSMLQRIYGSAFPTKDELHNTGTGRSSDEAQRLLYPSPHLPAQTFLLYSDPSGRKSYKGHSLPSEESWYVHNPSCCLPHPRSISVMSG